MPNIGAPELIIVLVIALLIFGPKRLPGRATERRRHVFDDDGRQDLFSNVAPSAPPFDVDDRRHDRKKPAAYDISKRFCCALLAPLERDQHSGIECERHAAFRRLFLGEVIPCHSASIRSMASALSGGTPYLSK